MADASISRHQKLSQNLLTSAEVAARLRITESALRMRRLRKQWPPAIRSGKRYLYPEALLDGHIAKNLT